VSYADAFASAFNVVVAPLPPPATGAPIPAGRGRWRLVAYARQFDATLPVAVAELVRARGRRLTQTWNTPAELTFTLDGHDPSAALLTELATDVVATRWDEWYGPGRGADRVMFRGLLDHSEDQITEQSATVTFTAHDYFAMLGRRVTTAQSFTVTALDQDSIVNMLYLNAVNGTSTSGTAFAPGNFLPLAVAQYNPDGTTRGLSGQVRDRTYPPGTVIGQAIDDLAKVQGGFDYDVRSGAPSQSYDALRLFYPQQGVARTDTALVYGANVSTVTRTVSSGDYANYVREIGNKASSDPNAPQLFSEQWNIDANNVTVNPVGLFMQVDNASDVSVQATLDQQAQGALAVSGVLTPSYTLGLTPGTYRYGFPNMGDAVPLVINEGRLNVNTSVRVVGVTYDVNDDGDENVTLTVGRPPRTLAKILSAADRDIDALARR